MKQAPLVTVIETEHYLSRARKLFSDNERVAIVDFLAAHPTAGESLGSGVRKMRWGSRAAFRVVHFYADERFPVVILDIFAKSEASNYSPAGLEAMRALAKGIRRDR